LVLCFVSLCFELMIQKNKIECQRSDSEATVLWYFSFTAFLLHAFLFQGISLSSISPYVGGRVGGPLGGYLGGTLGGRVGGNIKSASLCWR